MIPTVARNDPSTVAPAVMAWPDRAISGVTWHDDPGAAI